MTGQKQGPATFGMRATIHIMLQRLVLEISVVDFINSAHFYELLKCYYYVVSWFCLEGNLCSRKVSMLK